MNYLRIKDWSKIYENNRTRELKHMEWIPVPNKHDGDGYTILVDRENGAEMLGAWLAILQVASKCDVRGTLLRDGAVPHNPQSLARITRLNAGVFELAIPILMNECKWLESIKDSSIPAPDCDIPAPDCGLMTMEEKGREGKEEKGREGSHAPDSEIPSWEEFWEYCQSPHCGIAAEWYAKDKYWAACQDRWKGKSNWRAYATRVREWWNNDGRPMAPPVKGRAGKPQLKPDHKKGF